MSAEPVVVVGAGVAGVRTVQALRRAGYAGDITLVGQEATAPYDRPPLSKQLLTGEWESERILLFSEGEQDALGIAVRHDQAVGVEGSTLLLASRQSLPFRHLVIATGVSARRLPGMQPNHKVHYLRSLQDSLALREDLVRGNRVALVGAGFIGAEVATVARAAGCEVTMIEADRGPCARVLGGAVSASLLDQYSARGVRVLTESLVTQLRSRDDGALEVEVSTGERLVADLVVVGIGGVPSSDWTPWGNDRGIRCNDFGQVIEAECSAFAVGDVAAWPDPWGDHRRVEHWSTAVDHARVVAARIAGTQAAPLPPPYFWSDQFGVKLQLVGWPDRATAHSSYRGPKDTPVVLYTADGHVVAALTVKSPSLLARSRPFVARRALEAELVSAQSLRPANLDLADVFADAVELTSGGAL